MLRLALIAISLVVFVACLGLVVFGIGGPGIVIGWIAFQALVVLFAVLAERGRYRPTVSSGSGWTRTEERFRDPTSGRWLVVEYNPRTGERRYVESSG